VTTDCGWLNMSTTQLGRHAYSDLDKQSDPNFPQTIKLDPGGGEGWSVRHA